MKIRRGVIDKNYYKINERMNKLENEEVEKEECKCGESCECENCDCDKSENPLQKELEETADRLMRIKAEFENYKKREVKEREMLHKTVVSDIVNKMLPVIDNLEHAVNTETSDESYKEGVRISAKTIFRCTWSIWGTGNRNYRSNIRSRTS